MGLNPFAPVPAIIWQAPRKLTREEHSALLDEALRIGEELERQIDEMGKMLEQNAKPVI